LLHRAFREGGARLQPAVAKELAKLLGHMGSVGRLADHVASAAGGAAGGAGAAAAVSAFRRSVVRLVTARLSFDAKVRSVADTDARIRPRLCTTDGSYTWSWY
jgi:hypothetical protein